jgi:hypothetical protein
MHDHVHALHRPHEGSRIADVPFDELLIRFERPEVEEDRPVSGLDQGRHDRPAETAAGAGHQDALGRLFCHAHRMPEQWSHNTAPPRTVRINLDPQRVRAPARGSSSRSAAR